MKRAQATVGGLLPLGISFVVLAIALGLGSTVLHDISTDQYNGTGTGCEAANDANCSMAFNITGEGMVAVDTMAGYLPTIALVAVVAVILGIIIVYLARRFG